MREHRYRCAQALVFGLPVIGLALLGGRLGVGAERLGVLIQVLLAGWAVWVGAAGMVYRWRNLDALVGTVITGLFLWGAVRAVWELATVGRAQETWVFAIVVIALAAWTGARWVMLWRAG